MQSQLLLYLLLTEQSLSQHLPTSAGIAPPATREHERRDADIAHQAEVAANPAGMPEPATANRISYAAAAAKSAVGPKPLPQTEPIRQKAKPAQDATQDATDKEFTPSSCFDGPRPGQVFKNGSQGLGYYRDQAAHGLPTQMAHTTQDELTAGIAAMSLSFAAVIDDDVLAAIALELAGLDVPDWSHARNKGCGAPELAAMTGVCRSWRRVLVDTDAVWLRMIEARYPRLELGTGISGYKLEKKLDGTALDWRAQGVAKLANLRLTFREHFLLQADIESLRTAPQSAPLRSPGAQLQDFTFTIEAKCNAWHKGLWRDWDEGDRKHYPEGAWDSWTGTLPGFSDSAWWDLPDARQAGMGMLQVDEIEAFVSVYVTTPTLQTFKLYFDGTHEGSDSECDMPVESYTTQPLPYVYDQPSSGSSGGEVFSLYVKSHLGDVQLKFAFGGELDDEDVLTYLRGEAIPVEKYAF